MATKLESLIVDLQVNSAALRQGLDEVKRKLEESKKHTEGLSHQMKELGHVIAFEIGKEAVEALGEFILKGAEFQDQMIKASRAAGVGVEEFSKLAYAFKLGGIDSEGLSKAFKTLNGNLAEAATGGAKQAGLFKALGIAVKDAEGHLRSGGEVLKNLADKFSHMEDGPAKSALAVELFGKAGAQMITRLNGGAEGLEKFAQEAERFGVVVTEKAGKAAEEFVDNLQRFKAAGEGMSAQIAANLSPVLEEFTKDLLGSKEGSDLLKGAVEGLTGVVKLLLSAGVIVAAGFEVVGKSIARVASIIVDAVEGRFAEAAMGATLGAANLVKDVGDAAEEAGKRMSHIWDPKEAKANAEEVRTISGKTAEQVIADAKRAEQAQKDYKTALDGLKDKLAALRQQSYDFGATAHDAMVERLKHGDLAKELKKVGAIGEEIAQAFLEAADELERVKLDKLSGDLGFEQLRKTNTANTAATTRQQNFANITADPAEIFNKLTAGFDSFETALKESTEQQLLQSDHLNAAKIFEAQKNYEAARSETLLADAAGEAAHRADLAAGAFEGLAVDTKQTYDQLFLDLEASAQAMTDTLIAAVKAGASKLTSMLGRAGELANAAVQGFTTGGPWGAIIAVVLDLLSKFRRWGEVLDKAEGAFDKLLSDLDGGLGSIVDAFLGLIEAVQPFANIVHQVLNPILKIIGQLLKGFAVALENLNDVLSPILTLIADVLNGISGLLDTLGAPMKAVMEVLKPIIQLFGALGKVLVPLAPIFAVVGFVLKLVALVLLAIMNAIGTIINAIAKAFGAQNDVVDVTTMRKQMEDIATHLGDGFDPNGGNATTMQTGANMPPGTAQPPTGNGVTYAMSEADWQASREMNPGGPDTYQKYLESLPGYLKPVNAGLDAAAKNLLKFNESFQNMPSGYKLNLARFNATRGVDAGGPQGTGRDLGGVQMHGVTIVIQDTGSLSPAEFWKKMTQASERAAFHANGSTQRFDPAHP